jgi:hypothetical protein
MKNNSTQFVQKKILLPVEYPTLLPWQYMDLAVNHGFTQEQAKELSGFNRGTWFNWLYSQQKCPEKINRAMLEKLHRIACDMGWISKSRSVA